MTQKYKVIYHYHRTVDLSEEDDLSNSEDEAFEVGSNGVSCYSPVEILNMSNPSIDPLERHDDDCESETTKSTNNASALPARTFFYAYSSSSTPAPPRPCTRTGAGSTSTPRTHPGLEAAGIVQSMSRRELHRQCRTEQLFGHVKDVALTEAAEGRRSRISNATWRNT